jgi:UDP-N-acetylmuramate: L-alanyl-gamma-D-glutamyl-meso-diaminopimelate ligase
VVISPPRNLERIPEAERFDADAVAQHIRNGGRQAHVWGRSLDGELPDAAESADLIAAQVAANVLPGDVVAVLSNGGFGGIHGKLRDRIEQRALAHRRA